MKLIIVLVRSESPNELLGHRDNARRRIQEVDEIQRKRLKDIADGNDSDITEDLLDGSTTEVHDVALTDDMVENNSSENMVDDLTAPINDQCTDGDMCGA